MTRIIKGFYEASRYLGQYMGKEVPFLKETSCMGVSEREMLGILSFIEDMTKLDLEKLKEDQVLSEIIKPFFEKLGFAHWLRDTVTDMAIRKGIHDKPDVWVKKEDANSTPPTVR